MLIHYTDQSKDHHVLGTIEINHFSDGDAALLYFCCVLFFFSHVSQFDFSNQLTWHDLFYRWQKKHCRTFEAQLDFVAICYMITINLYSLYKSWKRELYSQNNNKSILWMSNFIFMYLVSVNTLISSSFNCHILFFCRIQSIVQHFSILQWKQFIQLCQHWNTCECEWIENFL